MTLSSHDPSKASKRLAVVPLVGNIKGDEAVWLGALLSRLLGEHLRAARLPALPYSTVARHLTSTNTPLPLEDEETVALRHGLKVSVVIHGRYVLDENSRILAIRLVVDAPDISRAPIHVSTPLNAFSDVFPRLTLALVERLKAPINDTIRQRVRAVPRPASFDAFRRVAEAQAAWNKGQKELALAAVTAALALDENYEDAAQIEVAIARDAGDSETARAAFRRWSKIALDQERPSAAAERLTMLGHWCYERGEWEEARSAYKEARKIYQREDNETGKARALNNLANLDLQGGKLHEAIRAFRRSLRIFEANAQTQHDASITLANLALAHKNLGQREEALSAIEQALNITRRLNDPQLQGHCLAQRGAIHDDLGDWTAANRDYQQAARLLDIANDDLNRAIITTHRAVIDKQQGNYERAESLLMDALSFFDEHPNPHEQAIVWLNLADLYFAMELYDRAWEFADRAQTVFARLKSGWTEQARELLDVLEDLPEDEPEPMDEDPPLQPLGPDDDIYVRDKGRARTRTDTNPSATTPPAKESYPSRQAEEDLDSSDSTDDTSTAESPFSFF